MRSAWCMAAAAAALLFSTPLASNGQDPPAPTEPLDTPILLRLVPPEGQVSRYVETMETDIESPMMPSNGPAMTRRFFQTQTVLSVVDEVIRFQTEIDSTATTTSMPVPGLDDWPDLSGSVSTTEMDARGRVLGVTGTEGLPDIPGFDPESLFRESRYFVFPEDAVGPGDSWTVNEPMDLPMGTAGTMSMELEMTYTFVSLEGSLATLSFEGPIDMELDAGIREMTASGAMTGTMVVDLAEGRFQSQSIETSLDASMAAMTMGMTMTFNYELIPDR